MFAIVLVFSFVLAGCGAANEAEEAEPTPSAEAPASSAAPGDNASGEQKQVALKFWGGVPPENGPQQAVDNWNKANPNIQVEYIRYVNDDTGNLKLDTALLSTTDAPDIFMTYGDPRMTKRVQSGVVEPLDEWISKSGFDVEGIIGTANIRKFSDGKFYYLPANKNVGAVLINKNALDEVGEKVPTSWNWDDYANLARKLNKGERKGTAQDPVLNNFGEQVLATSKPQDSYINENGKSNFDSPALKKGLELQKSLEDEGVMIKYAEAVASKLTYQNELLTGKAAMVPSAIFLLRYIKDRQNFPHDFKISFAPYPQYEPGWNVNVSGGMGDYMSINKNSANKEEAMKFIDWYLKEGNLSMVPGGRIPTSKQADIVKVTELLVGDAGDLIDTDSLSALLAGDYTFPTVYNVPAPVELSQLYKEEMEKYLLGAQSIDKTLEMLKSRADSIIESAKK